MNQSSEALLDILVCPRCKVQIAIEKNLLICPHCNLKFRVQDGIPIMHLPNAPLKHLMTAEAWGKHYRELLASEDFSYPDKYTLKDYEIIERNHHFEQGQLFLELGCGRAQLSLLLTKRRSVKAVGLDISIDALNLAKTIFEHNNESGLFVCGDMLDACFPKRVFDLIFAGGSIEHVKDTKRALSNVYNMLRVGGTFIATVPIVSISTLMQALLTGSIPDPKVLRNVYSLLHYRILKGRRLFYGYEKLLTIESFLGILQETGFEIVKFGPYDVEYDLKFFPGFSKRFVKGLLHFRLFWPMIYVVCRVG